ncbi:MAG: Glu-tRNA(Gln) amidotransferase subunit GatD [Methanobacteriaceae archaeon]|jgi:glutamyl-tRNA(Gln) amidotransferase subunit D|nr:Glu-tRNA(Gln) amidotransferase subunit GatD [Candidatus Methanorudis spinitermitis]
MPYKELAKDFLDKANISIGDRISIEKEDISYKGILRDRSEDGDDGYIVLKLDNGYNLGVDIANAKIKLITHGQKLKIKHDGLKIVNDPNNPNLSIISTGGTVASTIDYKSGAVHPEFTAEDLLRANPELLDYANYNLKTLFNILSENIKPEHWVKIAKSIFDNINSGADGIVVAHGTDTMHYTSAALSFILETPVPIVVTGAQKSSDRPSTDAYLNLINSVGAAKSEIGEVTVCMHADLDDEYCFLHRGTKVRKMHTSRRDTFRSINAEPIATLKDGKIVKINPHIDYNKRGTKELNIHENFESKVAIIKNFPGISPELIDYHIDKGYKGLLIEGTGLGHVGDYMFDSIKRAREENIAIVMTSQCLYGKVNMNVYSTGRKLINANVISGGDMTPETAYVKLCWALGQSEKFEEVEKIITRNIAGELSKKSSLKHFLN